MKESSKSHLRRKRDPFWNSVFRGTGIDIGAGEDPFKPSWYPNVTSVRAFDVDDGDAQFLTRHVKDTFDFVHSSNCLEHMTNPQEALLEWWAVVKPGGYLVFTVPDEDLYEQGQFPSQWNNDHKWTFTIWKNKSWCDKSINVVNLIAALPDCQIVRIQTADTNYDHEIKGIDQTYLGAEAFIEVVLLKKSVVNFESGTFKHSGARGDIIYSLPTIKALGGGKLFLLRDSGAYMGRPLSEQEMTWMKELLIGQCGITEVLEADGKSVQYNLDRFRLNGKCIDDNLAEVHLDSFGMKENLSLPWLDRNRFQPKTVAKIIINRSGRYAGPFRWQELKGWEKEAAFIGFPEEHDAFQKTTGIKILIYTPESYVDICRVLLGSSLFIGNQSFVYSLAEALKVNRVQEACLVCPNCLPQSNNGCIALSQKILQHYVHGEGEKPESINKVHVLFKVRNRFSGTALPNLLKLQVPIYKRPLVACVILSKAGKSPDVLLACLSNLSSKEVVLVNELWSSHDLEQAVSKTTSELICFMEDGITVGGAWVMELCGMMTSADVGAVGNKLVISPVPHVKGLVLTQRRVIHACGLPSPDSDKFWLDFALRLKNHDYIIRQARSGNIVLKE